MTTPLKKEIIDTYKKGKTKLELFKVQDLHLTIYRVSLNSKTIKEFFIYRDAKNFFGLSIQRLEK